MEFAWCAGGDDDECDGVWISCDAERFFSMGWHHFGFCLPSVSALLSSLVQHWWWVRADNVQTSTKTERVMTRCVCSSEGSLFWLWTWLSCADFMSVSSHMCQTHALIFWTETHTTTIYHHLCTHITPRRWPPPRPTTTAISPNKRLIYISALSPVLLLALSKIEINFCVVSLNLSIKNLSCWIKSVRWF